MASYQELADIFNKITYALNVCTIIGSVMSFIIFSRKPFEKNSFGFYCKLLAIFDLFVMYNLAFGLASIILNSQFINYYDSLCKLYYYVSSIASPMPVWTLVIFSFDQLIVVSKTEKFAIFKKRRFQYASIPVIIIFHCALYIPVLFLSGVEGVALQNQTFYSCVVYSKLMPVVFLIESNILPFMLIIVSMFFLVTILIKSREKVFSSDHQRPQSNTQLTRRRNLDVKFAFNLVALNIIFIVLTIPIVVCYILPVDSDYLLFSLIYSIGFFLFYLNFALHFWVHLTFNSIFRREFLLFIRVIKID